MEYVQLLVWEYAGQWQEQQPTDIVRWSDQRQLIAILTMDIELKYYFD